MPKIKPFHLVVAYSIGLFLVVVGGFGSQAPIRQRQEFATLSAHLTADADNTGPTFRTFEVDSLPGVTIFLRDVLLRPDSRPLFADRMRKGAAVRLHFLITELDAARRDPDADLHCYGLVVNGESILDFDAVIADQPAHNERTRWSGFALGGLALLIAVAMTWVHLRQRRATG